MLDRERSDPHDWLAAFFHELIQMMKCALRLLRLRTALRFQPPDHRLKHVRQSFREVRRVGYVRRSLSRSVINTPTIGCAASEPSSSVRMRTASS